MNKLNDWVIKDQIKKGIISYSVGDEVTVYRRKSNGYPAGIKDDVVYTIKRVENDAIYVAIHSSDSIGWLQPIKVHKTYMITKMALRNIKLNSILDETN